MKPEQTIIDCILDIIVHQPGCGIHDVADFLPDLTLNEIVDALRYLSRKGQLELIVNTEGGFAVTPKLQVFN